MDFLAMYWVELGTKLWEQIILVGLSTLVAILLGVSAGCLFFTWPKVSRCMVSFTGIIQTIPSLALLTFLLPFLGIGLKPALTALILYALLPILCNTLAGLQNVSPDLKKAAVGLGFTSWQQLFWVELPLAFPVILVGIKTALIINVGVATLAAFIGAGGLGDFINRGLALNNNQLILLGAIPAALLALILDALFTLLAKIVMDRQISRRTRWLKLSALSLFSIALIFLSWHWSLMGKQDENHQHEVIRIASKNFTESIILGEIISQTIESKTSLRVKRYFNLGSTEICHQALLQNKIDMYPEYTGTAYLIILHGNKKLASNALFTNLKNIYEKQFHLTWLVPFGFNNTEALAVTEQFAKQHHLEKISDLVLIENQLIAGIPSEFTGRSDGLPGLKRVYQLQFGKVDEMAPSIMYQAIEQGQVNLISAFSTDGRLQNAHLVLLEDDKHLFPPYDAAIVARAAVLKQYPEISVALQSLTGAIQENDMQELNYQVDIQKLPPKQVARNFLKKVGIIPS